MTGGAARAAHSLTAAALPNGGRSTPAGSPQHTVTRLLVLQFLIAWLPVWALFATLILTAHRGSTPHEAAFVGLRMIVAVLIPVYLALRLTKRLPWPHPFRIRFALFHMVAAAVFAALWIIANSILESLLVARVVLVVGGAGLGPFLVLGVWIYVIVAGVSYATTATERAARAEAEAARSQLAALRAQLHPHFLFNALHTVVQLIPEEPGQAARAAEMIASLLRTAIEENRDLVTLGEEWSFVERYLDLERIRFGDRLQVRSDIPEAARDALVPCFALQTLVENAVRHGAAPNEAPTELTVTAATSRDTLAVTVRDTGVGASVDTLNGTNGAGTGLRRLRERLAVLYGAQGTLDVLPSPGGVSATLRIPLELAD